MFVPDHVGLPVVAARRVNELFHAFDNGAVVGAKAAGSAFWRLRQVLPTVDNLRNFFLRRTTEMQSQTTMGCYSSRLSIVPPCNLAKR